MSRNGRCSLYILVDILRTFICIRYAVPKNPVCFRPIRFGTEIRPELRTRIQRNDFLCCSIYLHAIMLYRRGRSSEFVGRRRVTTPRWRATLRTIQSPKVGAHRLVFRKSGLSSSRIQHVPDKY